MDAEKLMIRTGPRIQSLRQRPKNVYTVILVMIKTLHSLILLVLYFFFKSTESSFFSLPPTFWTAMLVALNLDYMLLNHIQKTRFLYKIQQFGTVMFELVIHFLEHDC